MRILLVEDDPALRRSLAATFREEGYAVDTAADGEEGLAKANGGVYDAVVLDVMLPLMNGWEVLERMRPDNRVPVLMLTARDTVPDRVKGLDNGADDYLTKPFDVDELLARVRALIRRSEGLSHPDIVIRDIRIDTVRRRVSTGRERSSLRRWNIRFWSILRSAREVWSAGLPCMSGFSMSPTTVVQTCWMSMFPISGVNLART